MAQHRITLGSAMKPFSPTGAKVVTRWLQRLRRDFHNHQFQSPVPPWQAAHLDIQVVPGDVSRRVFDAVEDIPDEALAPWWSGLNQHLEGHCDLAGLWGAAGSPQLRRAGDGEGNNAAGIPAEVHSCRRNLLQQQQHAAAAKDAKMGPAQHLFVDYSLLHLNQLKLWAHTKDQDQGSTRTRAQPGPGHAAQIWPQLQQLDLGLRQQPRKSGQVPASCWSGQDGSVGCLGLTP